MGVCEEDSLDLLGVEVREGPIPCGKLAVLVVAHVKATVHKEQASVRFQQVAGSGNLPHCATKRDPGLLPFRGHGEFRRLRWLLREMRYRLGAPSQQTGCDATDSVQETPAVH